MVLRAQREQGEKRCLTTVFTEEQSMAEALPFSASIRFHHSPNHTPIYKLSTGTRGATDRERKVGLGIERGRKLILTRHVKEHSLIDK